nr:hypothetical protein [Streptomyces atratus]
MRSSSRVASSTRLAAGYWSFHANGLHASISTMPIDRSPVARLPGDNRGSMAVVGARSTWMDSAGSTRVNIAHRTWLTSVMSMSSSTTTKYRSMPPVRLRPAAASSACMASPAPVCSMETTIMSWRAYAHTPLMFWTPEASR